VAGLGFKDFQVGEVLTSSDVDGYLMQQTVMRFADAAARGSALGTATGTAVPLAEGMLSYLDDVDDVQVYQGTAWVGVRGLVAVEQVVKTDTQASSVAAGSAVAVSGLTISHAVADAANKVLLIANVNGRSSAATRPFAASFTAGGTAVGTGAAAGSRSTIGSGNSEAGASAGSEMVNVALTFLYTPGSTSSITYGVDLTNVDSGTETLYVNRTTSDTDGTSFARAASTLTLLEVKP